MRPLVKMPLCGLSAPFASSALRSERRTCREVLGLRAMPALLTRRASGVPSSILSVTSAASKIKLGTVLDDIELSLPIRNNAAMEKKAKKTRTARIRVDVTDNENGFRADRALAVLVPAIGRRASKAFFHNGHVRLNGGLAEGSERVHEGDRLEYPDPEAPGNRELFHHTTAPRLTTPHGRHVTRLYEDDALLVISKPAEIPVHKGQGGFTRRDTLEDVLARAYPPTEAAGESGSDEEPEAKRRGGKQRNVRKAGPRPEPGFYLVHRLDMETSGCLLVAKSRETLDRLVRQFSERKVEKRYWALVVGDVPWTTKVVKRPIVYERGDIAASATKPNRGVPDWAERRRSPKAMRGVKKGKAVEEGQPGKSSETHFRVVERFLGFTLLECEPKTGRTHQIRVHLSSEGYPLAYDPLYGRTTPLRMREFDSTTTGSEQGDAVVLNRLPLHAALLAFAHPSRMDRVEVKAVLPNDLKEVLRLLRKYRKCNGFEGRGPKGARGTRSRRN